MMRQRLEAQRQRRAAASANSNRDVDIPLPLGGLFVKARTAKVGNLFAAELNNLRPNGVSLVLRPGVQWEQRESEYVLQRIPYEFGTRSDYINLTEDFAQISGASIFRRFNGAATWAAISSNIIIADGLGDAVRFDGSDFHSAEFTCDVADPSVCNGIVAHHDRVYLWQTGGKLEFLYGDVGQVTGALQRFPLDRLGNITGSISAMVSLTVDAGHGMNDVLCIITTTGQLVVYEGFNPSDAADWRLTGRVQASRPIGPRAFAQVGSDAWMLTPQGVVSIGQSLRESVLALSSDLSKPISDEITALIEAGGGQWQLFTAADGSMAVINRLTAQGASQFIYYIEGKAWTTANIEARDFHNLNGVPQITALDGKLGDLRHTGTDEQITGRWVSSWFSVGANVSVNYIEPVIMAQGPLTVRVAVLSDYQDRPADIAEAEQIITLEPEETGGTRVTLSDIIPTDASGKTFQITLEVTARWAEITGLTAAIGS
jgi:hypothetical protein